MGMDYESQCSEMYNKREKKQEKKEIPKPPKKFSILVCVDLKNICIFFLFFFKVTCHGLCITVFRNVQQKGKKQEKKERPKPPKKILHTSICRFKKYIFFLLFFFKSNLSWIMHHSVQKCTTKGKKTRKKRKTKTPQKNSAY